MKAISINGSPRKGGNTEILLKKVLEPLKAAGWITEYLRIGGKPVRGCMACMNVNSDAVASTVQQDRTWNPCHPFP
jgi:multimeric flavodoxin WrbA